MNPIKRTIDNIPALWFEPEEQSIQKPLVILLPYFTGSKDTMKTFLIEIAKQGFYALSFDPWQHGERSFEAKEAMAARVFNNFRRSMWPILGNTTLETCRIIDWALRNLNVQPSVYLGGLSMGGDIAVAAAALDSRIKRVATVVSTPDWLRPGMHDPLKPTVLMPPGFPDPYARFYYDHLNPLTHLSAYDHEVEIKFICGEKDTHIPPEAAFKFQSALENSKAAIEIEVVKGMQHLDIRDNKLWWPQFLSWLTK